MSDLKTETTASTGGEASALKPLLCGCGREVRYSHIKDGKKVMSCNKRVVCLTYDQQFERIRELKSESDRYKKALQKIVEINGMDYEYKAWAKEVLPT